MSITLLETVKTLRDDVSKARHMGKRIAIVPTMGALHAGHISLVKKALEMGAHVIATIFVNPLQFAPTEDLSKYPRTFEADREKLIAAGAHGIYLPSASEMYPQGFDMTLVPGGVAKVGLEDRFRPTHFQGVATVVAKLFTQSGADFAMFGEKDYQQLKVVAQMSRDLDLDTEVVSVETTRESDGLALSSRNVYLSAEDRTAAPALHKALQQVAAGIRAGHPTGGELAKGCALVIEAGFSLDYFEARNADTLAPLNDSKKEPIRLLVAAKIGNTRLIDNIGF